MKEQPQQDADDDEALTLKEVFLRLVCDGGLLAMRQNDGGKLFEPEGERRSPKGWRIGGWRLTAEADGQLEMLPRAFLVRSKAWHLFGIGEEDDEKLPGIRAIMRSRVNCVSENDPLVHVAPELAVILQLTAVWFLFRLVDGTIEARVTPKGLAKHVYGEGDRPMIPEDWEALLTTEQDFFAAIVSDCLIVTGYGAFDVTIKPGCVRGPRMRDEMAHVIAAGPKISKRVSDKKKQDLLRGHHRFRIAKNPSKEMWGKFQRFDGRWPRFSRKQLENAFSDARHLQEAGLPLLPQLPFP